MQATETLRQAGIIGELYERFGEGCFLVQPCADGITTLWVERAQLHYVLRFLKPKFPMLHDLFGIDERLRVNREGQPNADFTIVYHLLSFSRNEDIRLKMALVEPELELPTIVDIWPNANWYEREVWDMFGITFSGHPNLYRILMPPTWEGHPLRKDHPARATEMEPFSLDDERQDRRHRVYVFESWSKSP